MELFCIGVKMKSDRLTVVVSTNIWFFQVDVSRSTIKKCTEMRVAR